MSTEIASEEIEVGGSGGLAIKLLAVLGAFLLISGCLLIPLDVAMAAILIGIAFVLIVIAAFKLILRRRRLAWIRDKGDGFAFRNARGAETFDDDQVVGIQVLSKNNYSQGVLKSVTRTIELKVAGRNAPIELVHTVKLGEIDPLENFLNRTIAGYRERAEEALDAGVRLNGQGWSVGRDDLAIESAGGTRRVPIAEIVAIDSVDGQHNVWKRGDESTAISIAQDSENAFLLELLLRPRILENVKDDHYDATQPGLGRQIFQRTTGRKARFVLGVWFWMSVLMIPIGLGLLFVNNAELAATGFVLLVLSPGGLLISWAMRRMEFRCHERGVYRRSIFGSRELRFEDVETFTYGATRQYYNGAYVGTSLKLTLTPPASANKKKLSYSRTVQNADEALDSLRDHISEVLATGMMQQLRDTGSVQWMPNVRIASEGFFFRPKRMMGRKEEELLPYEEVTGFDIQDSAFHVWKKGAKKSVIHESVSEPNFFPGHLLMMHLFAGDAAK